MRMIGYYVFHTIINQIRKLCKTWVIVLILVCGLMGGLIGLGAAYLADASSDNEEGYEDEWEYASEEVEELEEIDEGPGTFYFEEGLVYRLSEDKELYYSLSQIAEASTLIAGILIMVLFLLGSEKNGGKIFLMADVNLLFTSPMKPQSILLFRLLLKLGTVLIFVLYMGLIYLPNFVSMGILTTGEGLLLVLGVFFLISFSLLLQVLIYTLSASEPKLEKIIQGCLYGIILLALGGFLLYWRTKGSDLPPLICAIEFGSIRWLRAVPLIGWLKGMIASVFAGKISVVWGYILLMLIGNTGLIIWIWSLKADFYEDAMTKSEEVAALQRKMQEKGSALAVNKKQKEKKLSAMRRPRKEKSGDGFVRGSGAAVYFYKAMHIRYRFAKLHYFTSTTFFYFACAAIFAVSGRIFISDHQFLIGMMGLCVLIFFRSMGNPVEEDTGMDYFRMIPCSMTAKLFYSLLGAAVNCLLDALPAVLLLTVVFQELPWNAAAWLVLALSITLYASAVGAFMDVSIPIKEGVSIKQTIQILFIYFGLLPDAALLAVGLVLDEFPFAAAVVIAFALNMLLTILFTICTGNLLAPKVGDLRGLSGYLWDRDRVRIHFSRIGWALFALYAGGSLAQLVVMLLVGMAFGEDAGIAVTFASSMLPLYAIGFPLGIWLLRRLPDEKKVMGADAFLHEQQEKQQDFGPGAMIRIFFIMMFVTYLGVFAGNLINLLLTAVFGSGSVNVIETIMEGSTLILQFIFMVVLAPIFEEYVFRKVLIDRMAVFGEKRAVLYSALLFGLFHGNLNQTIYASLLGIVLGYVYLRSRKVRYTILLHMIFNFMGSIVAGWVTSFGEESTVYLGYQIFIIAAFLLGGFLLLVRRKKIRFYEASQEFCGKGSVRAVWGNGGMLTFSVMMGIMILIVLAGSIISLYI